MIQTDIPGYTYGTSAARHQFPQYGLRWWVDSWSYIHLVRLTVGAINLVRGSQDGKGSGETRPAGSSPGLIKSRLMEFMVRRGSDSCTLAAPDLVCWGFSISLVSRSTSPSRADQ